MRLDREVKSVHVNAYRITVSNHFITKNWKPIELSMNRLSDAFYVSIRLVLDRE